MFRGRNDQTIDMKGRIMLPVRFREILNKKYDNTLVITNHFDTCLIAYPTEEWVEVEEKVRKLPSGTKQARNFKRFITASAAECTVDKQGRVLIPPSLKTYAQLEKDIVIAGLINHFEIWTKDLFYGNLKQGQDFVESEEIGDLLNELDL